MTKSDELKKQAIAHGLCEQWQREWVDGLTDDELIDRYKRGIDFAIAHDWPSVEYIKSHFDDAVLHEHGIWNDENVTAKDKVMVLNGACGGRIEFGEFEVATIYVRHTSNVIVKSAKFAKVRVVLHDDARVMVIGNSASPVYVYRKSNTCKVDAHGLVEIRTTT